ncbi:MAG TPA: NADH-quinone oxidoreductase subunit C [Burkholderiales bacterium]
MSMRLPGLPVEAQPLPGALAAVHAHVSPGAVRGVCEAVRGERGRLVSLWGSDETTRAGGYALHLALALPSKLLWLSVPLPAARPEFADLSDIFPQADRMQRAARDLVGIRAVGGDDRKWLRHGAWPEDVHPLRKDFDAAKTFPQEPDRYPFVKVEGEGVHEMPVGPVHAGTIEPGHFRFSIVGEKLLRLEERLGYVHKGIEKRFESMTLEQGAKLAGRVSGDSTVAYAWAYAMAAEGATRTEPPARALALRAVMLELERIANHLGDLGYLGNDVAFSFGFFQFWRLKEELLRRQDQVFGHRYCMDCVVPGGVSRDLPPREAALLAERLDTIESESTTLKSIYEDHAGAQDRFIMTGQVVPDLAERMGLTGLAGRASGQRHDLRVDHPVTPYAQLDVRIAWHGRGDVAARVSVRFDELFESIRLVRKLLDALPQGPVRAPFARAPGERRGIGWVEGWRGDVLVALETDAMGNVHRVHPHDPSWQNWPLVERAVLGNIVPDFPLINKSFNLSYSGQDL